MSRYWRESRELLATQRICDGWLASAGALALAIPSANVPEELNYLLNPPLPPSTA